MKEIQWTPGDQAIDLSIRISIVFKGKGSESGMVAHICDPRTQEVEAGGSRSSGPALTT